MAGRKKTIDPRTSIFISEILTGASGAAAARTAGYSAKTAARQAHRLLNDDEIKAEIERGLAAVREGAEVSCESMIRQLDADRLFAIKTCNASAATRASELKAKLVGLLVDRKDTRLAHFVKTEAELAYEAKGRGQALHDLMAKIDAMNAHAQKLPELLDELAAPEPDKP